MTRHDGLELAGSIATRAHNVPERSSGAVVVAFVCKTVLAAMCPSMSRVGEAESEVRV